MELAFIQLVTENFQLLQDHKLCMITTILSSLELMHYLSISSLVNVF